MRGLHLGGGKWGAARVLGGDGCKGLMRKKMGEGGRPRERGGEGGLGFMSLQQSVYLWALSFLSPRRHLTCM